MSAPSSHATMVSWGAVTALGLNAPQTAFSRRAGRTRFAPTPFVDAWGERIVGSFLETLPGTLVGVDRLIALAMPALSESLAVFSDVAMPGGVGFALSLPTRYAEEGTVDRVNPEGRRLADTLRANLGVATPVADAVFPVGRAGGALAVAKALEWMRLGTVSVAVVGGVDSSYDWDRLRYIEAGDRLITEDNLDGMIPGEGAGFVVFAAPSALAAMGRSPVARVVGVDAAMEPHPVPAEETTSADGFTAAIGNAVRDLRSAGGRFGQWWTDLTHEDRYIREYQVLLARFGDVLGEGLEFHTPPRDLGDIGAATLPVFFALAGESWYREYGWDRLALCTAGSDGGARGAVLLEAC